MTAKIQSYKDLIIWQRGMELVLSIYQLTADFPKTELFGLTSQMRRSAVSVVSNIAEGYARRTDGEFLRFLLISRGSAAELETQLLVAKNLKLAKPENFTKSEALLTEVLKMSQGFINKLKKDKFSS